MSIKFYKTDCPTIMRIDIDGKTFGSLSWCNHPAWSINTDTHIVSSEVIIKCVEFMGSVDRYISQQSAPINIHIGYDDHVSGFLLTPDHIRHISTLTTSDDINKFIVDNCERTEINEAELFLDMMNPSPSELMKEIEFYCPRIMN